MPRTRKIRCLLCPYPLCGNGQERQRKLQLGCGCAGDDARLRGNDDALCAVCLSTLSPPVFVVVSALQIYIKMNTGEDGVVKSIVSLVGACLFIIGASIDSRLFSAIAYRPTNHKKQSKQQ